MPGQAIGSAVIAFPMVFKKEQEVYCVGTYTVSLNGSGQLLALTCCLSTEKTISGSEIASIAGFQSNSELAFTLDSTKGSDSLGLYSIEFSFQKCSFALKIQLFL